MDVGLGMVLAVCGGGGSDTLAILVLLLVALLYLLLLLTPIRAAEDWTERLVLLGLFVGSALLGGLLFTFRAGFSGDGDYLRRFLFSLPIAAAVGFGIARTTNRVGVGRALLVALAGDVFVPGGVIVLLFTSVGIGSGCLE